MAETTTYTLTVEKAQTETTRQQLDALTTCIHCIQCLNSDTFVLQLTESEAHACRRAGLQIVEDGLLSTCDRTPYYIVLDTVTATGMTLIMGHNVEIRPFAVGKSALLLRLNVQEAAEVRARFPSMKRGEPVIRED